jgi:hypothetical protein
MREKQERVAAIGFDQQSARVGVAAGVTDVVQEETRQVDPGCNRRGDLVSVFHPGRRFCPRGRLRRIPDLDQEAARRLRVAGVQFPAGIIRQVERDGPDPIRPAWLGQARDRHQERQGRRQPGQ